MGRKPCLKQVKTTKRHVFAIFETEGGSRMDTAVAQAPAVPVCLDSSEKEKHMSFASRHATLRASLSIAAAVGLSLGVVAMSSAQAQTPAPARPAANRPAAPAARPAAPAPQAAAPAAANSNDPTVVQVKGTPDGSDWTKQCGPTDAQKIETCLTVREFVSENDQPVLAVAASEMKGPQGSERRIRFLLPFGLALDAGVRFSVDRSGFVAGKYSVCMPNGCFADVGIKDETLKSMKTGNTFNVTVKNAAGNEVVFAIPSTGFAKAFDGPAVDPKVVEERQRQLEQDVQRKSEQMRRELEARGAGGLPAPAPTAPPAGAPRQ